MTKSLKKAGYVLAPLFIYLLVNTLVSLLLQNILIKEKPDSTSGVLQLIIVVVQWLAGAVVLIFYIRFDSEELALADYFNVRGLSFYRKDRLNKAWVSWALIILQGLCAAIGLNVLIYLSGLPVESGEYNYPVWMGVIAFGLISPAVEEFVFRLVLFGRMKRKYPFSVAVILSAVFFGFVHMNFIQIIYAIPMGILMCFACEYVHSVLGAFVFHATANLSIYLLSVSGVFGSLINIKTCVIFMAVAVVLLLLEIILPVISVRKKGRIEGIAPVGCFYIDYSYESDEADTEE